MILLPHLFYTYKYTMKKAIIKLLVQLFFLTIIFSIAFVIGYVQLWVPIGKYGVLLSKTGGYYENIISHEGVTWRWERLIPTNSTILLFNLSPIAMEKTVSAELENGKKYAKVLANTPDFSWNVDIKFKVYIRKEKIVEALKKTNIKTEEELTTHFKDSADSIVANAVEDCVYLYQEGKEEYDFKSFKDKIKELCQKSSSQAMRIEISSIKFSAPDFATYKIAKIAYAEYASIKKDIIMDKIEKLKALQNTLQELSKDVEKSIVDISDNY